MGILFKKYTQGVWFSVGIYTRKLHILVRKLHIRTIMASLYKAQKTPFLIEHSIHEDTEYIAYDVLAASFFPARTIAVGKWVIFLPENVCELWKKQTKKIWAPGCN